MGTNTGSTILVVDDDTDARDAVVMSLSDHDGYTVLMAQNMNEALECIQRHAPTLVITDQYMPGGTGLDLIEKARRFERCPPFILMSASPVARVRALLEGHVHILSKPFTHDELHAMVRARLEDASASPSGAAILKNSDGQF